jgi:uncharacterized protein
MNNREIIETLIKAFKNNDTETIINLVTDDFEWKMMGDQTIPSKDALIKFFSATQDLEVQSTTVDHIVIDGDKAVVTGDVVIAGPNNMKDSRYYCDIYILENAKLKQMLTYTVHKK